MNRISSRSIRHGFIRLPYHVARLLNSITAIREPRYPTRFRKCSRINWHFSSSVGSGGTAPVVMNDQMSRKIHGDDNAYRPTITPAHPVRSIIRFASPAERMSPFPTTGIAFTDATTSPTSSKRQRPEYCISVVRPCTTIIAAPALSRRGAKYGATIDRSSQPSRIFTVSGIRRSAPLMHSTIRSARPGSHNNRLPPSRLVTFSAGQPMFKSTTSAP